MKPSAIAHRPGSRPKLPRSWVFTRHRRSPPQRETRGRSNRPSSTKPIAGFATLTQKADAATTRKLRRIAEPELLNKEFTNGSPPPLSHRRHRSRTPTGQGRAREDLFHDDADTNTSPPSPGTLTLENLIPTLLVSKRMTVSTTSRYPAGCRR
jgi:hypothetical protein